MTLSPLPLFSLSLRHSAFFHNSGPFCSFFQCHVGSVKPKGEAHDSEKEKEEGNSHGSLHFFFTPPPFVPRLPFFPLVVWHLVCE